MRKNRWGHLAISIGALAWLASCASAPPSRTQGMSELGVQQTTAELRVLLRDYLRWFAAQTVVAANKVLMNEEDLEIQEAALFLKVNAVPAMQAAVFQRDPMAALSDAWAITAGLRLFFEEGAGANVFGASQDEVIETMRSLEEEVIGLVERVVGPEKLAAVRPEFDQWVHDNPYEDLSLGQRSKGVDAASVTAAQWGTGGLRSVAQLDETARDLSDRLTIYAEMTPRLARWNGELLLIESQLVLLKDPFANIDSIDTGIHDVADNVDTITDFVTGTPQLIGSERDIVLAAVEKERLALLESVDRQRDETLATLRAERQTVLDSLEAIRRESFADLGREMDRNVEKLEAFRSETLQEIESTTEAALNQLFWRALILLLIALVGVGLLMVVWRRRSGPESQP